MRRARAWLLRLKASLGLARQADADMRAELDSHIQLHVDDLMRAGLSEADARKQARLKFGSAGAAEEAYRDRRGLPSIDSLAQDLRYALRVLLRARAFSAVAVLVLALGIGVTTAIFSIVYAVYLKPLPVAEPGQLVYLYAFDEVNRRPPSSLHGRLVERHLADGRAFSAIATHVGATMRAEIDGAFEMTTTETVSANYFDVLGVKALHGRTFTPDDGLTTSTDRVVVITYRYWKRRFDGDPAIMGKEIRLGERGYAVVGITPEGFNGLNDPWRPTEIFITRAHMVGPPRRAGAVYSEYPIARLRPGVTLDQARAIVASHDEALDKLYVPANRMRHLVFGASDVRMPFDPFGKVVSVKMAAAMMALIMVVLAIAAANVAGLLMARGVGRRTEIGVRMALGAAGTRVTRQLLTESVVLAVAGGAAGLLVGWMLIAVFHATTPSAFALDVSLNLAIFWFTAGICLLTGLIVGAGPALQASRVDVLRAIGGGAQSMTRRTRLPFRYGIIVPQIALSLVLLLVAGVYLRDLLSLERADLGFRRDGSFVTRYWMRGETPGLPPAKDAREQEERHAERVRNFYRAVTQRLETSSHVASAAMATTLPTYYGSWKAFTIIPQDGARVERAADRVYVSPQYFDVMGMRVLSGRAFDERDTRTSPKVAIVSASVAKMLWPDGNALGRFAAVYGSQQDRNTWLEVVGIVNDVAPVLQELGPNPIFYLPLSQQWRPSAYMVIARPAENLSAAVDAVRSTIDGADVATSVTQVRTMEQMVGEILYPRRLAAGVLAACSGVGLILACIGLYGVVAYSMAQRQREIGIRAALGAERRDIMRLVMREGFGVLAAGSLLGFALAAVALPSVSNLVIAVAGPTLALLAGVPLLLALVVLAACLVPARRASRVNPMDVLRSL